MAHSLPEDAYKKELSARAEAPYIIRREYNGCTVYRRCSHDYIPFDLDALSIFTACCDLDSEKDVQDFVAKTMGERVSPVSLRQFTLQCQDIGLITQDCKLAGHILDNNYVIGSNRSAPNRINLQLTRHCGFQCKHCWANAGTPRPDELSLSEIDSLFKQMSDMGCYYLNLEGGDYFEHKDFWKIISKAKKTYGFCVNLSTNAVSVKKNVAENLAELQVDSFCISLDAGTEKTSDIIYEDSSVYRKSGRGIRHLLETCNKSKIYFHSVINRNNSDIPSIIKRAEEFGVKELVFDMAMPVGRAIMNPVTMNREEMLKCIGVIKDSIRNHLIKIELIPYFPPRPKRRAFEGFGCECGNTSCFIASDGSVYPSALLSGMPDFKPIGNIRSQSLFKIWNEGFKRWRSYNPNEQCKNCRHYKICRGGCRTRSLIMNGSMRNADPCCSENSKGPMIK
ncbi:radical SAM protein [bacterium]|nr:radical SAM protein [bacterium]